MKLLLVLTPVLFLSSCATSTVSVLQATTPGSLLRHGPIVLELKTSKATYRDGELVTITLTSSRRATVKIFNEDAKGNRTQLWPNAYSGRSGIVETGKPLVLPAKGSAFRLKAGPPFGINTLIAVASSAPFREVHSIQSILWGEQGTKNFARKGMYWNAESATISPEALTGEAHLLYETTRK